MDHLGSEPAPGGIISDHLGSEPAPEGILLDHFGSGPAPERTISDRIQLRKGSFGSFWIRICPGKDHFESDPAPARIRPRLGPAFRMGL